MIKSGDRQKKIEITLQRSVTLQAVVQGEVGFSSRLRHLQLDICLSSHLSRDLENSVQSEDSSFANAKLDTQETSHAPGSTDCIPVEAGYVTSARNAKLWGSMYN